MKIEWQKQIDAGVITTHETLHRLITACGFQITRNGANYLGFLDQNGARARVHFDFANHTSKGGKSVRRMTVDRPARTFADKHERRRARLAASPGGIIYALVTTTPDGPACYVGQTMNFKNRMSSHLRRSTGERGSGHLFALARAHDAEVNVVVLQIIPKLEDGRHDFDFYHEAEASWFQTAVEANYQVPGSAGWANFGKACFKYRYTWPAPEIERKGVPIEKVVADMIEAITLAV